MIAARAWRWLWLALWLLAAPAALAQAALPIETRILVSGCTARINERSLHDQLRVELLAAGVQRVRTVELYADALRLEDDPKDVATLRVLFADCEEDSREIRLGVAARVTGRHAERTLAVSDVPEGMRARAIALALTELLRSTWRELTAQAEDVQTSKHPQRVSAREVVRDADADAEAALSTRARARLEWQGSGRIYPQTVSGDVSSSFGVSKLFGGRTRMQFAALAAGGGGQGSDAHLFEAAGRVVVAVCSQGGHPGIEVGAALEAGWAHMQGTNAGRRAGFLSTAGVQAVLRVPAAIEMEALVLLQAGYVLTPVTMRLPADESGVAGPRVGFGGPFIGLAIGLAGLL